MLLRFRYASSTLRNAVSRGARLAVIAGVAAGGNVGCSGDRSPVGLTATVEPVSVTGEALSALDHDGHFVLPSPPQATNQISAAHAAALADAYEHTFARFLQAQYERDRGGPIDVTNLAPCGRVYFATSPYVEDADLEAQGSARIIGSHWLVTMCDGASPVVSVAVSVFATGVQVRDRTIVKDGDPNDFFSVGIRVGVASVPMTPESAVSLAYAKTGARVNAVPELIMPPTPYAPQIAYWRVPLERAVDVRSANGEWRHSESALLVGLGDHLREPSLFVADPTNPGPQRFQVGKSDGGVLTLPLFVRDGYPNSFVRVEVEK